MAPQGRVVGTACRWHPVAAGQGARGVAGIGEEYCERQKVTGANSLS